LVCATENCVSECECMHVGVGAMCVRIRVRVWCGCVCWHVCVWEGGMCLISELQLK
jgi:hypothetical protein